MILPPTRRSLLRSPRSLALCAAAAACLAPGARGQTTQIVFGVDYRGATISTPDTATGTPITEADQMRAPFLLPTFGPLPAPQTFLSGADLGLNTYTSCVGHAAGTPCTVEVDALSFGTDARFNNLLPQNAPGRARLFFSVDRAATGVLGSGTPPNVFSEGAAGQLEAAADVFTVLTTITGPIAPGPIPGLNRGVFDGNGLPSSNGERYPGFGLREPPALGPFDDLDTLSIGVVPTGPGSAVYFSLDGNLVNPQTGLTGTGSAQTQGVSPSAVLKRIFTGVGSPITIYATPQQLGLHPVLDDIDALLLAENGDGVYQPSTTPYPTAAVPYDWLPGTPGGPSDMLLFSLRQGSATIGTPDSQFGIPIEPGDVLLPPLSPGLHPRIFIPAEEMGLRTSRSSGVAFGDEVDALASAREPFTDCNNNGRDDAQDIALGSSSDTNNNNIPDECEQDYTKYCYCVTPNGPCGNDDATAGCKNSTGAGALLSGSGTTSVATDDLVLTATSMTASTPSLFFRGPNQTMVTFGDGLRCVGNPTYRMGIVIGNAAGTATYGPGIVAASLPGGPPGSITVGSTWRFQVWYRDSASYCTVSTFNLTNGLNVVFSP